MKILRYTLNAVATLVIWLAGVKIFGGIQFTPGATDLLIRLAAMFDVYGDENIENFYMMASMLSALALSVLIVWIINLLVVSRGTPSARSRGV